MKWKLGLYGGYIGDIVFYWAWILRFSATRGVLKHPANAVECRQESELQRSGMVADRPVRNACPLEHRDPEPYLQKHAG